MKQSIADTAPELLDEATEVLGWMRRRSSDELQAFICRRLALVEDTVE